MFGVIGRGRSWLWSEGEKTKWDRQLWRKWGGRQTGHPGRRGCDWRLLWVLCEEESEREKERMEDEF